MMNDINACFISYRHTDDPAAHAFVEKFVSQLEKQLKWWLPNAPVFFDKKGVKVGDAFNEELAFQLCRSACMVIFFSALHFDVMHPYCALEYRAMLRLEEERLGPAVADLHNKRLVFVVVFRGLEHLPPEIRGSCHCEFFENIVVESDFEGRDCQQRLNELAKQIHLRYLAQYNAGVFDQADCRQFRFPEVETIQEWLIGVSPIRNFRMPSH